MFRCGWFILFISVLATNRLNVLCCVEAPVKILTFALHWRINDFPVTVLQETLLSLFRAWESVNTQFLSAGYKPIGLSPPAQRSLWWPFPPPSLMTDNQLRLRFAASPWADERTNFIFSCLCLTECLLAFFSPLSFVSNCSSSIRALTAQSPVKSFSCCCNMTR